jgi:hypothetical protein
VPVKDTPPIRWLRDFLASIRDTLDEYEAQETDAARRHSENEVDDNDHQKG